jgi:hypothetical protein
VRGGLGRSLLARLRPDARIEYLRSLDPGAHSRYRGGLAVRTSPRDGPPMHDVVISGIVAACTKWEWRGTADEAVAHVFGG